MNLLMISGDRSIASGKQGAFWYTLDGLRQHFDRIDIITPTTNQQRATSNPFTNIFLHPSPHGLWYQPRWIRKKGKELIREHHHAVMTIHDYPPFYNGMGGLKLAQEMHVPAVEEIHHIVGYPAAASCSEWIGARMSKFHLPRGSQCAAAVRCVSEETAKTLRSWNVPRVTVVPSIYLDHDELQPDPTIAKKYDIVCCGRLQPNKGIDKVIDAAAVLPEVTMLIIGDGPERTRLEARAGKRVTFAGWLPENHDVYRAMQSAKIFVMNSSSEGGPRVALEAMALGMPVIVTKVGLMPEVIEHGHNGMFTTGTPDDLAVKILMLLKSEELRDNLGKNACEVLTRFERKKLIKEYAEFLKNAASVRTP